MISRSSVVVASKGQVSSDLAGEAVILNMESGVYYGLDEVGARIWAIVQEPKSVQDIMDVLMDEYEVSEGDCERDLVNLLERLTEEGLVVIRGENDAS